MFKRASTQIMTHGTEVLRGPTIDFTLMSALPPIAYVSESGLIHLPAANLLHVGGRNALDFLLQALQRFSFL